MRRPMTKSAAHDIPSAANPYTNALIQPLMSMGNSNACASATAAIACPVKLHRNAACTLPSRLPAGGCKRGFEPLFCSWPNGAFFWPQDAPIARNFAGLDALISAKRAA